jgi:cAMP-dependent protein kinase regulator
MTMSDPRRDVAVPGTPSVAFSEYEALVKAWAQQGWLMRAIALCKVLLRLDPEHEPLQRLLVGLDLQRLDAQAVLAPPRPPVSAPEDGTGRDSLLARLGEREFESVMKALELRDFLAGETIVEEGEPGGSLFVLVEGSVEVVRTVKSGRRRTVAFLGEGDFFGELSLLPDMPRLASVKAFERTAVLELKREQLDRLVQAHPNVGEALQAQQRERLLDDVIRANPLFRLVPLERRKALAHAFELSTRPAGAVLIEQGKDVDALYLLLRGQCQALHCHPDGREQPLRTLKEGDVFGEIALLLGLPATAKVRADTPCLLLRLDWGSCEQHLLEQPEVREALSRMGTERLLHSAGVFWEFVSREKAA